LKNDKLQSEEKATKLSLSNPLLKESLRIAGPAFVELVLSTLFGMVDMMMVGRVGPSAIAAVGLTNQPFNLLIAVFAALNVGTTALVAWNIGSHNIRDAQEVTRQSLKMGLILGIIFSILGVIAAPAVITFMGAQEDTFPLATQYFQIVGAGLIFLVLNMVITAALRGAGETKIPMFYNLGANLFNVFGNYVLIYGKLGFPKLGVAGAAISTVVSRLLACLTAFYVLYFSKRSMLALKYSEVKESRGLDASIIKRIFAIGIPSAVEQFVIQSGLMFFGRIVAGLGTSVYAAHQISLNINGLTFSPSQAFGVASTTLVGQSLGANDPKKAEQYANIIHKVGLIVACGVGLGFILFSHPIARLYTDDLVVAAMAGTVLKIMALAQPGQSTQLILSGALRGAGDTTFPLIASLVGIWGVRVVLSHIFVRNLGWGLVGAWMAMVIDQYTRSLIVFLRFRSDKWKYKRALTVRQEE